MYFDENPFTRQRKKAREKKKASGFQILHF